MHFDSALIRNLVVSFRPLSFLEGTDNLHTTIFAVCEPSIRPRPSVGIDDLTQLLYLPSYSPEFNPIEQAFAKLKALLRSAAARTIPDLWAEIPQAYTRFTPLVCRNYLAAAGYEDDLAVAT